MTNTIETKTIETPADAEILYGEIREDNRRGGWMRLYDAGTRHLLRRGESEIEHEPAEDVQTKAGDGPPWMFLSFLLMFIVPFVAALVYFAFCFVMSRYGLWLEQRRAGGNGASRKLRAAASPP